MLIIMTLRRMDEDSPIAPASTSGFIAGAVAARLDKPGA